MVVCGNQTQTPKKVFFSFTLFRLFLFFPRVCDTCDMRDREKKIFPPCDD